ncbi:protein psiQ-like [Anopheles albimanus]|uniref:protein psiQ-like n=1 Tax=Anopheles albimanus TaxID=7167 RepID=UPI00163F9FCA|nr:protein psiQ-like [Anopheles albimanus]
MHYLGDVLHRKCRSTLTSEQQQLCTGSNEGACITCNEDGCNSHTLLKSIQCKKSIDPLCRDPSLSNELSPKYCSRFHQGALCYSRILDEDVERGCTSDPGLTEAVCGGNKYCLTCATNGCNKETEDFLRDVARCLRCRSSKGENINCEEAYGKAEECDQQEDECFTRVEGETIERNCLATLPEEDQRKCLDPEDNTCLACHGHDCNRIRWRKCYTCSKLQDPRCVAPESQPSLPVLFCDRYRYEDVCYAKIVDENDLVRGCGSDLAEDGDICEDDSRCMKCDMNGCNSIAESALLTRSRCLSCLSGIDGEECEQGTLEPVICDANNGCYTRVDDGVLERGCLSELDEISEQLCLDETDSSCIVCEEASCNTVSWLKCIKCKKSVDPLCTNPLETSLEDLSSFCSKYGSEGSCYSRATEFDLERGCSLELPNPELVCDNTIGCATCLQANCNDQPEDSLREGVRCVQCSSSDTDCNGEQLPSPNRCPSSNQHCFTRIDDGTLVRGCLSSLSQELQRNCEDENNPSCIVCTEDGCNTQKWPRCYRCTSASDISCDTSLNTEHLNFCDAYNENVYCHSWIQDGEVSRDCTIDKETVCADNNRCLVCEEEGCNSQSRELLDTVQTCYHCSSSTDQCDSLEGTGTECRQRIDRCYTRVSNGVLTRGCLSDMDSEAECLDVPAGQCIVCDGNDCNQQSWNTCCDDPWKCVSCLGSGCNEGSSESYFAPAYCIQCRSDIHRECLNGTMESVKCGKPADLCFYHRLTSRIIERGCFSDLSPVLQATCSSTSSHSCLTCTGLNCNGVQWSRCYQCSSYLADRCDLLQNDEAHLKFCLNAADHCFEERDGEEIRRGCGESYCEHKKTCVECVGDGCNGNAGSTLLPSRCSVSMEATLLCIVIILENSVTQ